MTKEEIFEKSSEIFIRINELCEEFKKVREEYEKIEGHEEVPVCLMLIGSSPIKGKELYKRVGLVSGNIFELTYSTMRDKVILETMKNILECSKGIHRTEESITKTLIEKILKRK